jgi:hypothetical protein
MKKKLAKRTLKPAPKKPAAAPAKKQPASNPPKKKLAAAPPKKNEALADKIAAVPVARIQHLKDAEKLLKDDGCWIDARSVRAETRRVMAARAKAFRDAGLRLKRKESL